jgi:excisionase family DNA binding protein
VPSALLPGGVGRADDRYLVILRNQRCYKKGDFERSIAHRDHISSPWRDGRLTTSASGMILVAAMKLATLTRAQKRPTDATPPRIITVAEVAEYLRVHQSTIYKMATRRQIPFFKIGFDYRFHRDAIDKWMTDGTSEVLKKSGAAVRAAPKKNRDST